jgi:hypothetical protein
LSQQVGNCPVLEESCVLIAHPKLLGENPCFWRPQIGVALPAEIDHESLWAACFLLTYTFPLLNDLAGTGFTFRLYAVICVLGLIFTFRSLPETNGKILEEIERNWHRSGAAAAGERERMHDEARERRARFDRCQLIQSLRWRL